MSETVLHTKLFIPPLRPSLVARPRLVERLNKAANARLILVSAPAGFGKTTLVTTWLGQQEQPAAWVSLDESDNTPQRIFIYLLAAIQTVYPDLGQKLLVALNSPQPPADDALIPALINELSVKAAPLVLVLDDYHVIRNQTIHNALSFFVDYLPPAFQLVLTSREDPPLPLPRWRARGQLLEIRAPDLRFTGAEVPAFLEETMGLQLEEAAVTELADRTEGWVAGLQLAALSIRSSEDVPAFVKSFGGSDRQIADYLLQEVLLRQPSAAQQFMLRTALLDRFNADSCDHLLEQENSQEMLDALDLSNLFLIPLDNERFWYRYHHLFAQLLRHRLLREVPAAEAARLHRRAAQWYEGQGYREEAIAHALQIPDLDYTAQMVSSMPTHALYEQGGTGLVKQWAEALPPEIIQRYPRVAILAAGAYMITGDAPNLRKVLALIAGDPSTQAEQALFQSIMVRNQDADYRQALHLATVAFKGVKAGDRNLQAVANLQIAVNQLYLGQLAEAEQTIINLRQTIDKEDPTTLSILFQAYHMQSSIAVERADYFQAQNICREGLAVAEESGSRHAWPFAALLYCRLAGIYYQWNEYEPASEYQALALDWGKRTGISDILIEAYLVQADLAAWKADREAVFKAIDGIKAIIVDSRLDEIIARMEALTALYYWRTGAVDEAVRWANASGYSLDNQPTFQQYNTYLPLAKIRFAECRLLGNKQAAAAVLALTERVLTLTSGNQYRFSRIECLTLKALILAWQDKRQEALEALAEALDLAQPGTLVRVFLDWGRPMQELLAAAAGLRSTYTGRLLEAFTAEGTAVSPGPSRSHSSEPAAATALHLTGREQQILQLIASGLSNKEIEETLFISINTVRTHIKNLYSKLEVESRTQAVQRAGQLGLL